MIFTARTPVVLVLSILGLMLPSCAPQEEPIRPNIRSMMAGVPAGAARRATPAYRFGEQFAPEGGDLLDLMGIEGASYVVKAPASVAGGCQIEDHVRIFVDGNELWPRPAGAKDEPWHDLAPATAWVVDILAWPDSISSSGYTYRVRVRPLDGARHWVSSGGGFFRLPDPNAARMPMTAFLYQCEEREVAVGKEVPLTCLFQGPTDKNYKAPPGCGTDDAEQLARASRFGVVFYIRLRQKSATPATLPAMRPAS